MARLGRAERQVVREYHVRRKAHVAAVVAFNLTQPKPERSYLSRDETKVLMGNTHTRGIRIGHRKVTFQKPGSY